MIYKRLYTFICKSHLQIGEFKKLVANVKNDKYSKVPNNKQKKHKHNSLTLISTHIYVSEA